MVGSCFYFGSAGKRQIMSPRNVFLFTATEEPATQKIVDLVSTDRPPGMFPGVERWMEAWMKGRTAEVAGMLAMKAVKVSPSNTLHNIHYALNGCGKSQARMLCLFGTRTAFSCLCVVVPSADD
jgi:hypothetical protein